MHPVFQRWFDLSIQSLDYSGGWVVDAFSKAVVLVEDDPGKTGMKGCY